MNSGDAPLETALQAARAAARQEQFLDVLDSTAAWERFAARLSLRPLPAETVPLSEAQGRVLADDVAAPVDVPAFDRSNVDGFAIRAADSIGATDAAPRRLRLNADVLSCGTAPVEPMWPGTATVIATGGMIPRGADAVVMMEHTDLAEGPDGPLVEVLRPAVAGQFIAGAGSDIARGETVLRRGTVLGARELAMLAAVGMGRVAVVRRPRVAILSTGDELMAPGSPPRPAGVYDSNGTILAASVRELGGEPVPFGIVPDDAAALTERLEAALDCDMVLLSGGTSKGAGDLSHRVVGALGPPGILVHGVALKPGKPLCLAVVRERPLIVLPGFPTSAIFTFHQFAAPVIRAMAGLPPHTAAEIEATVPMRVPSERGRTEFVMVALAPGQDGELLAYPIAKGSGAVSSFAQADGFFAVPAQQDAVEGRAAVRVQLIAPSARPADLTVIGSHCVGLDRIVGHLFQAGLKVRLLNVGSQGGLAAAKRGECDIAPIHLLDPATGVYNRPFVSSDLVLVTGYRRLQGLVFRKGDVRFAGRPAEDALAQALADPACIMVNRNAGSGTRILIDRLLGGTKPGGYAVQPKSHNAVAAAVVQGRADWGVAIDSVARAYGLDFIPLQDEAYDFVLPAVRRDRAAIGRFLHILSDPAVRSELAALGFRQPDP